MDKSFLVLFFKKEHLAFLLLFLLSACGGLPRPFEGLPGNLGAQLSQPPPARLAIPTPRDVFLTEEPAAGLARVIAEGLLAEEVPIVAGPPRRGDWTLVIGAEHRGSDIVPMYRVLDPSGEQRGITEGLPVPASQWVTSPPLRRVAGEAVPRIASLLSRIEAARRQSDPNSLANRAPRLFFATVSGAPGDGNASLARTMKAELVKAGQELRETPEGADFRVEGQVVVVASGPGKQRVEIQWIVNDAKGSEAGRVVQLNEIPAGSLDLFWGDVALVVAQEAAPGVRDVITARVTPK